MRKLTFLILAVLFISATSKKKPDRPPKPDKPPKPDDQKEKLMNCQPLKRQFYQCTWQSYDSCCNLKNKKPRPGKPDKDKPDMRNCQRLNTPKQCHGRLNMRERMRIEKELKKDFKNKVRPIPQPIPDPDDNGR